MAPEFFQLENNVTEPSESTDVWGFGMTVYVRLTFNQYFFQRSGLKLLKELITGEMPYSHITNDAMVLFSLAKGELPSAPETSTMQQQNLWSVCKDCWQPPRERPNMPTMCRILIVNAPFQASFH